MAIIKYNALALVTMTLEYTIEFSSTRDDLARKVRKMITNGWEPIGGLCVDIHEDDGRFLQCMIRNRN